MRDILFRGFHADEKGKEIAVVDGKEYHGEWVEGDFCHPCSICFEKIGYDEVLKRDNTPTWNDYTVLPETVGEYTGLADKNGNKIFEGDKVNWDKNEWEHIDIVEWDYDLFDLRKFDWAQWCEVIGTIFDKENG